MSITKGVSVILVAGVLAGTSCTRSSDRPAAFVGQWTMDTDMYVECVRIRQEERAAGALANYTKMLGSEDAAREQVQKQHEKQLDFARQRALQFELGGDGSFTARSSWKSPRGASPQNFQGRWIAWPKGVILFDTEVVPSTMTEPSPALGWILAMEPGSRETMRLYAGRLGSYYDPGLEFTGADRPAGDRIEVPVASVGSSGADTGFAGTWRYDTQTVVGRLEETRKRVGGESKLGDSMVESMASSRLNLVLHAEGRYVIEASLTDPDGERKHMTQSGAWYRAGDVVVCIGELGTNPLAVWETPHRTAFVLERASGGGFQHVAGIMPLLNVQPPVPFHPSDSEPPAGGQSRSGASSSEQ